MACKSKSKQVAIEELTVLLCFIESENVLLEQEKKDLTIRYHSRPPEERNIMRDILEMHSEFEKDIIKLKEITEDFSKIPHLKNNATDKTEERLSLVAKMQQCIITLQERSQELLLQKSDFDSQIEAIQRQHFDLEAHTNLVIGDIERLQSLENEQVFDEQCQTLENEIDRLAELALLLEGQTTIQYSPMPPTEIPFLTESQAADELRRVSIENSMIEEAVNSYAEVLAKANQVQDLELMVDEKKGLVEKLRGQLMDLQDEVEVMESEKSGYAGRLDNNIKILDKIIGRKTVSPRNSLLGKNKDLLNDVISSINRAKALTSPNKFK